MKRDRKIEQKTRRKRYIELGLCMTCGKENNTEFNNCLECGKKMNERTSNWRRNNPIRNKEIKNNSYLKNHESILKHAREYSKAYWLKVIIHYGAKCSCCGETIIEFLTIDHMYEEGHKQRNRLHRQGRTLYLWLVQNNYPEGYQVMCFDCNCGRARNNGICPHKQKHLNIPYDISYEL